MKLAITGANGYIGERFVAAGLRHGHTIVALGRRPPATPGSAFMPFDLADGTCPELPDGVGALIHLAATTQVAEVDIDGEVAAAKRLISACARIEARFVFVSSQTAREDAPTAYGRAKWLIEREVRSAGGLIIRPGQVYGRGERALFGTLVRTLRGLNFIPAFVPTPQVQPVHVDDLAEAILLAIDKTTEGETVNIGAESPIPFTSFLLTIAAERLDAVRPLIPVPGLAIRMAATLLGAQASSRLGVDRLLSLFELPVAETADDMRRLGITLRPLALGMARSGNGRRRALLREGRALLAYVLREAPAPVLMRRYARCVETLRSGAALGVPRLFERIPPLLALLDDPSLRSQVGAEEFVWRMQAALVLAEASPQGARRFLLLERKSGLARATLRMTRAVGSEASWRFARWCLAPLLRSRMPAEGYWR